MSKYIFQQEEGLGDVVQQFSPFCTLSLKRPITRPEQITSDICGSKFSKLCGFCFISNKQVPEQKFMIVYCPKTRNNYVRNNRGLSGWYCWKHIGFQNEVIMDRSDLKSQYGFDVNKFFQSDVFEKYVAVFQKQTSQALDTVVKSYVDSYQDTPRWTRGNVQFFVGCVRDSLSKMTDVIKAGENGEQEAKLAYNADKTYALKTNEDETNGYPNYEFNNVGDLESFFNYCYNEKDMSDRENLVFWDKNGREMKIVKASVLNNGLNFWFD